jgi:predicted Rossmann fold nucleotide-binding protein DprA/Smf involved in DNA uptake
LRDGTVAVFAGGIDHIYPAENAGLFHAIWRRGMRGERDEDRLGATCA